MNNINKHYIECEPIEARTYFFDTFTALEKTTVYVICPHNYPLKLQEKLLIRLVLSCRLLFLYKNQVLELKKLGLFIF